DGLRGAGAVVVRLELRRSLRLVADNPPAGEHRAERARVAVGHPHPPDELAVGLHQRQQALAPAGEHRLGRGAGGLDEALAARLVDPLAARGLLLLRDRAGDVERDHGRAVLALPVELGYLEDDPVAPPTCLAERGLVELETDAGVARLRDHLGARPSLVARPSPASPLPAARSTADDLQLRPWCGGRGRRVDADGGQLDLAELPVVV